MNNNNKIDNVQDLIDIALGLGSFTTGSKFKVLGVNTDGPAGQTLVGTNIDDLVINSLSNNETNIGTVESTYASVVEEGDGNFHKTTLSLTGALPAIAGGADLAVGRKIYTFPAGIIRVNSVYLNGVTLTQTEGNVTADTPDLGVGTTVASGIVAVLGGTGAFENLITGQTMADCDGAAKNAGVGSSLVIHASGDHEVYLNVADGWAASGDSALAISGDVVITWELLS